MQHLLLNICRIVNILSDFLMAEEITNTNKNCYIDKQYGLQESFTAAIGTSEHNCSSQIFKFIYELK